MRNEFELTGIEETLEDMNKDDLLPDILKLIKEKVKELELKPEYPTPMMLYINLNNFEENEISGEDNLKVIYNNENRVSQFYDDAWYKDVDKLKFYINRIILERNFPKEYLKKYLTYIALIFKDNNIPENFNGVDKILEWKNDKGEFVFFKYIQLNKDLYSEENYRFLIKPINDYINTCFFKKFYYYVLTQKDEKISKEDFIECNEIVNKTKENEIQLIDYDKAIKRLMVCNECDYWNRENMYCQKLGSSYYMGTYVQSIDNHCPIWKW